MNGRLKLKGQFLVLALCYIAVTGLFAVIVSQWNIRLMRQALIAESRLSAAMIDVGQIARLSGSVADLASPDYQDIKRQLAREARVIPKCRFVYLAGMRPDGTVFFYADSEEEGSPDESPPGQVYTEVTPVFRGVFLSGRPVLEGPYTDRWGTWVTGLFPLSDPGTGQLVAVLGVDIASEDWYWEVAARSAVPVALFALFSVILLARFFYRRHGGGDLSRPVLKRLLMPLGMILGVIIGGFAMLVWWQQHVILQNSIQNAFENISGRFHDAVEIQGRAVSGALEDFAADGLLQDLLARKDRDGLMAAYQPLMETLSRYYGISYFNFLDAGRRCLLAVHNPGESDGGVVDCITLRKAVESGETASGIGVSPIGTLSLKVIRPVFYQGELAGYIAFGQELDTVLDEIMGPGIELAVVLHKDRLEQDQWESGAAVLENKAHWDTFPDHALAYASAGVSPDKVAHVIRKHEHYSRHEEVSFTGRLWRVSMVPLYAPFDQMIGDMIILYDVSDQKADFKRLVKIAGSVLGVLLAVLFSFLVVMLKRTDQSILDGQRRLRESESRFQSVVSNVPGVIFRCRFDADWTMEFISDRIQEITGYPASEFIHNAARTYQSVIHPEDRDAVARAIAAAAAARAAYTTDYRVLGSDPEARWVRESGRVLFDQKTGQPECIDGVIMDITDQRCREEEMREMQEQLGQSKKMAAVGKLSAGVAHEIKNPLAIILLSLDALELDSGIDGEARRLLGSIRTSAQRANRIIVDLLNFSRQRALKLQPLHAGALTGPAVSAVEERARGQGVTVEQRQDVPDGVVVDADPVLMEHALLNIFQNALDAMPSGGTLTVETRHESGTDTKPDQILIRISDTGCGIPAEVIDRIFDPFMTTKDVGEGTGLGLSLVYAVIDRHKGKISVESVPGQGAVFMVCLPCRRQS